VKRKEFYIEYYKRTDRIFSDKIIWFAKDREEARRKGQICTISKFGRKVRILVQYLALLLCLLPLFQDNIPWALTPILLIINLLDSFLTDFSIIKIEVLYFIYQRNGVFGKVLHEIFLGEISDFIDDLRRETRKVVTGYVMSSGGKFFGRYMAVCRDKNKKISVTFKRNKVVVLINGVTTVIKNSALTKEELLFEISTVINETL